MTQRVWGGIELRTAFAMVKTFENVEVAVRDAGIDGGLGCANGSGVELALFELSARRALYLWGAEARGRGGRRGGCNGGGGCGGGCGWVRKGRSAVMFSCKDTIVCFNVFTV